MKRSKNPGSTDIILLLGAAGLAYWWWSTQSSTALPAGVPSTATTYYPAGGGTSTAPKIYDAYLNAAGIVVAMYNGSAWVAPTTTTMTGPQLTSLLQQATAAATVPATITTAAATTPVTPVTIAPNIPPATTPASTPAPMSLASLLANLTRTMTASGDPAVTVSGGTVNATPYVFNYYLALPSVNGNSSTIPTAVDNANLSTLFPGVSPTNPMTLSTYWSGMGPYLGSSLGMSGLRGLGYTPRSPYYNLRHGGWAV